MAVPKITLYLDIVSPFAYIAYHTLRHSPTFAKCDIAYVPIFLGGLMHSCRNRPPIEIKNKDKYINKERKRWSHYFSVPIVDDIPSPFPAFTLNVQRIICAVSFHLPDKLIPVIDAFYRSYWIEGNGKITQPEVFFPVLETVLGKDRAEGILKASSQPDIKERLLSNTGQAFNSGAFGIPWFECTNSHGETDGFWGVDHLGQVAEFLGLDRSLDRGFRASL